MSALERCSAKTICKQQRLENRMPTTVFEERVVLFLASGFEDAIERAEAEATRHCEASAQAEYPGYVDAYHVGAE